MPRGDGPSKTEQVALWEAYSCLGLPFQEALVTFVRFCLSLCNQGLRKVPHSHR